MASGQVAADGGAGARRAVARLARRLAALPPSLGQVRLVAVDGHAGSGKSTLARRLSAELGGAPVVRLDDLATHDSFFGWEDRLARQVLAPLARGEAARYRVYDWARGAFTGGAVLAPAPVVLLEGVGAGRASVRPALAALCWLDLPAPEAWRRGQRRDGPGLEDFWDGWKRAERDHFADDPSRPHADILLIPRDGGYAAREREGPGVGGTPLGRPAAGVMSGRRHGCGQSGRAGRDFR